MVVSRTRMLRPRAFATATPAAATKGSMKSLSWVKAGILLCLGLTTLLPDESSRTGNLLGRFLSFRSGSLLSENDGRRLAITDYETVGGAAMCESLPLTTNLNNGVVVTDIDECAALCDADASCMAFEYYAPDNECYLFGNFDPGAVEAEVGYTCYALITYMDAYRASLASTQGDPVITGLQGQAFKFEGRSDAWYANLASESFQWNSHFHQFEQCPKGEDMFIDSFAFSNFMDEPSAASNILVKVQNDKDDAFSYVATDCAQDKTCLANGKLYVEVGKERITHPGDYSFPTKGIRVIAHNTYGSCSRKWYDYTEEQTGSIRGNGRRLEADIKEQQPIDYLRNNQKSMLKPKECETWIAEREANDDLFQQAGSWSTLHILTPLISYHVELRQEETSNDNSCAYSSLDTWISTVEQPLKDEEWRGIMGETRVEGGKAGPVDRSTLLDYDDDAAYEVTGPFDRQFVARTPCPKKAPFGSFLSKFWRKRA